MAWLNSHARGFLVANGITTNKVTYK
jgi:hypothetical protein